MVKLTKLIEETEKIIHSSNFSDDVRLLENVKNFEKQFSSLFLDGKISNIVETESLVSQIIEVLFDIETDLAPRSISYISEKEVARSLNANYVASVVNKWTHIREFINTVKRLYKVID